MNINANGDEKVVKTMETQKAGEDAKIENILEVLLVPPTETGLSKSLMVEAREKAVRKSSNALQTWKKNCYKDAALILCAEGEFDAARQAATKYLQMDNKRG